MLDALDHLPYLLVCAVLLQNGDALTDKATCQLRKKETLSK
jgi:hypothetical protein